MPNRRDLSQSEYFHIVHRGADRQDIFSAESHRTFFQSLVAESFARFDIELHAYAWMTNHTHMLVRLTDGALPDAMHRIGSRYATAFNAWTKRDGPLFTARYFSEPIRSDAQLAQTARYIHRNPLAFVPASALSAYRWSSLGALCGRRAIPTWLTTGAVVDDCSPADYLDYVLRQQPSDRTGWGPLPPTTRTDIDALEAAVAAVTGRDGARLRLPGGRRPDPARIVMIMLAVEFRVADSDALAQRYGLSDRRSVRRIARRGRALMATSDEFQDLRTAVVDWLDAGWFRETRASGTTEGDAA